MRSSRASSVVIGAVVAIAASTVEAAGAAEHTFRTEHFALTWTDDASEADAPHLRDRDGDGVPDSVVRMANAFEDARTFLLGELGYQEPPTRGRYNLYLSSEIDRAFARPAPGGEGRSKPSFITIPTHFMRSVTGVGEVRTFAVHEYFHAVQLGYDAGEEPWIFEASSAWVEGLFGPAVDHNHVYLYDFVPRLQIGLTSADGVHEYGAFLFLQFLTERYGGSPGERPVIVRELWEAMAVPEAIEGAPDDGPRAALERVLAARGATLEDAWREFQLWTWQLHRFEKGDEYRRALRDQRWPTAPLTVVSGETCRLTANAPEELLPSLAGDYVRVRPADRGEVDGRITVRGPAGATAFAIARPAEESPVVSEIPLDASGVGTLDVDFGARARRVVLGLGNAGESPGLVEYSVRVGDASSVVAGVPAAPSSTIYGTGVGISGAVDCGDAPAPFARVAVTRTELSSGATETVELTTDEFGRWSLVAAPPATSAYSVQVVDPLLSRASSASTTVGVRVAVNMAIADDQIEEGQTLVVEGNVAPLHSGVVRLERRRPNGRFEIAGETTLDGEGRYRFDHVLPGTGVWEVRVTMPDTGDEDHLAGDSAPKLIQVGEA